MEVHNEIKTMLALIQQPAFLAEQGKISHVNSGAAACLLEVGQQVLPLILCGAEEYRDFTGGCLYLTLSVGGQRMGASVVKLAEQDIFTLDQQAGGPQLQALALAAMELREPLSGILSLTDRMLPSIAQENETLQQQAAQMNRRLYQMLRIVGNMSDAAQYAANTPPLSNHVEFCGFAAEILGKAQALTQSMGIALEYELPRETIFLLANEERLERAIYNLLSNAFKHASEGSTVQVKVVHKNKRLYFSVTNRHTGNILPGNLFTRFLREPGLEDSRNGIGLGMVLVREAAALHGGAVLADQTEEFTRITMTLQVRQARETAVRTPVLRIDYAGERDHGLLELADVLPATAYSIENME